MDLRISKRPVYKCYQCNYQGYQKKYLSKHLTVMHDEKLIDPIQQIFSCTHCAREFKTKQGMEIHNEVKHPSADAVKFTCSDCGNEYPRMKKLRDHLLRGGCQFSMEKVSAPEWTCDVCFTKGTATYIRRHIRVVHLKQSREYTCAECGFVFKTNEHLRRHGRTHAAKRIRYSCSACSNTYSHPHSVTLHFRKVHFKSALEESEAAKCDQCGFVSAQKHNLPNHLKMHGILKLPKFECEFCGKKLQQKHSLELHKRSIHLDELNTNCPSELTVFNCDKCSYCTHIRVRFMLHQRTIHAENREKLSCPICLKLFLRKHSLKEHQARHGGPAAKTKCDICGLSFARIKSHRETHFSRPKEYACDDCPGSAFAGLRNLKYHIYELHLKSL